MQATTARVPRPTARPRLTAVVSAGSLTLDDLIPRLQAFTSGLSHRDDVEVVLLVPHSLGGQNLFSFEDSVAKVVSGAFRVSVLPDRADVATTMRAGAQAARGSFVTFLDAHDDVSDGYLGALSDAAREDAIASASAPAGEHPEPMAHAVRREVQPRGSVYPVSVLRGVPLPTGLTAEATEAVLLASVAGSYRHQHLVLAPVTGASHQGPSGSSGSTADAVSGLLGLQQAGDALDAEAARALRTQWRGRLRAHVAAGVVDVSSLGSALTASGVRDVSAHHLIAEPPSIVLETFFSERDDREARRVVVVMRDVSRARGFSSALQGLVKSGCQLTLVHTEGAPPRSMPSAATVVDVLRHPSLAVEAVDAADDVISVGAGSRAVADEIADDDVRAGLGWLQALLIDRAALQPAVNGALARAVERSATALQGSLQASTVDPWSWPLLALRLLQGGHPAAVDAVEGAAREHLDKGSDTWAALAAVTVAAHPDLTGAKGLADLADGLLRRADDAESEGEELVAIYLHYLALELLFEPSQHTSVSTTPLVEDPAAHLGALRRSALHRLALEGSPGTHEARTHEPSGAVLLGGAFPKFAGILHEALASEREVTRIDLGGVDPRFANVIMDPRTFRQIYDVARGRPVSLLDRSVVEQLTGAEVVVADWADKGLALASRLVPDDSRLIARVHGVDTLSPWAHLTHWDRVDAVLAPSTHLADALRRTVGPRLDDVEIHVVPNPVDCAAFATQKTPAAQRTLGLVGWAQRVKDATFALEVLALLREQDPTWRLRLVGGDFAQTNRAVELEAAQRFRSRLCRRDVAGAVDFVPFTTDVPSEMAEIGWGLSTSLRESFHLGLAEMAASGSVPVVRDWPVYSLRGGAATLFPSEWVVADPLSAAARIQAVDAGDAWESERLAAREHVVRTADRPLVLDRLRSVIDPREPGPGTPRPGSAE